MENNRIPVNRDLVHRQLNLVVGDDQHHQPGGLQYAEQVGDGPHIERVITPLHIFGPGGDADNVWLPDVYDVYPPILEHNIRNENVFLPLDFVVPAPPPIPVQEEEVDYWFLDTDSEEDQEEETNEDPVENNRFIHSRVFLPPAFVVPAPPPIPVQEEVVDYWFLDTDSEEDQEEETDEDLLKNNRFIDTDSKEDQEEETNEDLVKNNRFIDTDSEEDQEEETNEDLLKNNRFKLLYSEEDMEVDYCFLDSDSEEDQEEETDEDLLKNNRFIDSDSEEDQEEETNEHLVKNNRFKKLLYSEEDMEVDYCFLDSDSEEDQGEETDKARWRTIGLYTQEGFCPQLLLLHQSLFRT